MTRAILCNWRLYTPFGKEFYTPMFTFFINQMQKYKDEYDKIYFLDSNWDFTDDEYEQMKTVKGTLIKVDPSLRYYDAYKKVLPNVKEDLVLLMDNDMVVCREDIIRDTFNKLDEWKDEYSIKWKGNYDVVSIIQSIGTMKVPLKLGNKFAAFYLATRKDLLMKYIDVDWSPDAMPYTETMGLLTEAMLKDEIKVYEFVDDQGDVLSWNPLKTEKNTGLYHIRAGSTIAMLLSTKHYGDKKTYDDYLKNQPKSEILRHCDWYDYMDGDSSEIRKDLENA